MKRRRQARAAFRAAAIMVEAVLNLPALPKAGEERLRGRAIASHIAREAFGIPIFEIAIAAGIDRRTVNSSTVRLWDRRDADADLEIRVEALIVSLRTMGARRALLTSAWLAAGNAS
jgi:hypothetical protein